MTKNVTFPLLPICLNEVIYKKMVWLHICTIEIVIHHDRDN